jgi:hypothetical protein
MSYGLPQSVFSSTTMQTILSTEPHGHVFGDLHDWFPFGDGATYLLLVENHADPLVY